MDAPARQVSEIEPGDGPKKKDKSGFIPAMANFNIQYNFTSASIAKSVMTSTSYLGPPGLYPIPTWADQALQACVFIGAMAGMLFMGRLGDSLGRMRAMQITLLFAAVGAVIPMFAVGSPNVVYTLVIIGRLVLGVGVGGIFPLSAVSAAEGTGDAEKKGKNTSQAFFWQTPGVIAPYLVSMVLFAFIDPQPPQEWVPQFEFRFLFGAGVIPGAIVFISSLFDEEGGERRRPPEKGLFATIADFPTEVKHSLLGAGGAWFLYDISYYGISIFTPSILDAICLSGTKTADGCDQTLFDTAWQAVITNSFGIPGVIAAILLIERWGSKRLNVYGFLLVAVCCLCFAIVYAVDPENTWLLFGLYCALTFSLNFGPNVGCYVLPAICFPSDCRSTCHGISATMGKFGAVLGTIGFGLLGNNPDNLPIVFMINVGTCILGSVFSQLYQKHDWEYLGDDDRKATASFVAGRSVASLRSSVTRP